MQPNPPKSGPAAKIDLGIAVCLGAAALLFVHISNSAAAEATQRYGRNVDSGVWEFVMALLYLAPLTLLFGFASLTLARQWRIGPYAHWVAIGAIFGLPFIDYILLF